MKNRIILDIMDKFSKSDISKLKIKYKKFEIELEKNNTKDNDILYIKDIESNKKENQNENEKWILSPIVGKYCKSELKVGDKVNKGDTLFTIESMKTFNEIKAEENYEVIKILANENDVLECNQKIILVRKIYD